MTVLLGLQDTAQPHNREGRAQERRASLIVNVGLTEDEVQRLGSTNR